MASRNPFRTGLPLGIRTAGVAVAVGCVAACCGPGALAVTVQSEAGEQAPAPVVAKTAPLTEAAKESPAKETVALVSTERLLRTELSTASQSEHDEVLASARAARPTARPRPQRKPRHLPQAASEAGSSAEAAPAAASDEKTQFARFLPGHDHLGFANDRSVVVGSAGAIGLLRSPLDDASLMASFGQQAPAVPATAAPVPGAAAPVTVAPGAATTAAPDAGSDQSWLEWLFWTLIYVAALGGIIGGAVYLYTQMQKPQRPPLTGRLGELQRAAQGGGASNPVNEESQAERRKKQKGAYRYSVMGAQQNSDSDDAKGEKK